MTKSLLSSRLLRSKVWSWTKLITITGSSQVLIQALGFVSGILVIRVLPVHEYALYTVANTMLGTLTILADGGIATGTMALGGKVWKDRDELGKVLSTGMVLRNKFAIGSLLLAIPILVYLLRHHEASWLMTVLITLSLVPAFFSALSGTILEIPLKLKQDITPLQKNQVGVNIARLAMLLLTIFIFPWAFIAILAAGIPQIGANMQLRKVSLPYANLTHSSDPFVQIEILAFVKRLMPDAIYYCLSGQITIWLISIFGSTEALAQLGALTRLTIVLSLFSITFQILIVPRFARLRNNRREILTKFIIIQIGLIVLCIGIVFIVSEFSQYVLWILGENFLTLRSEVVLISVSSCFAMLISITHHLLASKGVIVPPVVFIVSMVLIQVGFIFVFSVDTLNGILCYGIFTIAANYFIRLFYLGAISIRKESKFNLSMKRN